MHRRFAPHVFRKKKKKEKREITFSRLRNICGREYFTIIFHRIHAFGGKWDIDQFASPYHTR